MRAYEACQINQLMFRIHVTASSLINWLFAPLRIKPQSKKGCGVMKTALLSTSVIVATAWSYLRHVQLPVGPSRLDWGAQVFGHRGCRAVKNIPENTIPAFQYAITHGATGIELDVRLTKDNQLVVFHDAFFNGHVKDVDPKRRVDDMELFDVKQLCFVDDETGDIRIPTLEESVLFCRENQIKMLIEIKEQKKPKLAVDKVLELYKRYPEYMYPQTTVIAFSPGVLYNLRLKDRKVAVGQLYSEDLITSWINSGAETAPWFLRVCTSFWDKLILNYQSRINPWLTGVSFVCPRYTLYSTTIKQRWHSRRIAVYLWGFPNPQSCTEEMRCPGVLVACDDDHEHFKTAAPPPDFDIFGDKAREEERMREEAERAARRQRLTE